ncbi:MAG: AI-2E family transporter [Candidatus Nanohaloarchaeota archaeon QJJ-5]|nr:AI-2E family transporter [Candidatus Nanohaloarchaeota archaeon QJJ-5]
MVSSFIDGGTRRSWLFGFLILFSLIGTIVLSRILWTVVLAVIIAYVMYPAHKKLKSKGFSDRQASAVLTLASTIVLIIALIPVGYVLFRRRFMLLDFLRSLPETLTFDIYGYMYTVETGVALSLTRQWISDLAISVAETAPTMLLKLSVMMFLVAALLYRPNAVRSQFLTILPPNLQKIMQRYHIRVRETIFGIFRVQLTTALATFFMALPIFYFLGYDVFFSLSFFSGALQLIPVVGPSLLIFGLAIFEIAAQNLQAAAILVFLGIIGIGILPDLLVRPRLANRSMGLPPSLYILGFMGGVLTIGVIGLIIGPLLIALILETVDMLAEQQEEHDQNRSSSKDVSAGS